jgi:hypothetical protein
MPVGFFVLIKQHLGGVEEEVSSIFARVYGQEFESCTLVVIEFNRHNNSVGFGLRGFNEIKVTAAVIWLLVTRF